MYVTKTFVKNLCSILCMKPFRENKFYTSNPTIKLSPIRRPFLRQEANINALSRAGVITANKFGGKKKN